MIMDAAAQALVRQLVSALAPINRVGFDDNLKRAADNVTIGEAVPLTVGQIRAVMTAVNAAQAALASATTP